MASDAVPEALAKLQTRFAGHIRDPQAVAAPEGIEDRRMDIYRNLFFNNIRNFLSGNFPVLRTLFNEPDWTRLCRDFYTGYRCHTPLFPELPREFLKYLQDHRKNHPGDPPFMLELAHYEWVELALSLDETETDTTGVDPEGDLLNGIPVMSPLVWPLTYQFPVHRIRADFQPRTAPDEATHLLVWRRDDYKIKFMQLNEISMLLVQKMKEETAQSGLELLNAVASIINHPKPGVVVESGAALLNELREKQVVLGTRR
ncbi:MAG TPA: putative DNA-binding domain-containing protein [Xanthomonadales bacterium]